MPDKKSELLRGGSPSAGSASNADTEAARKRREADAAAPDASGDDSDHQVSHAGADRSSARGGAGGQRSRVSKTPPHGEQGQQGAKDRKSSRS